MDLEQLYNLDYSALKDYLLKYKDIAEEILKDTRIKEKLINPDNKYEFIWFTQDYNNDLLPFLLDDIGINILENSDYFEYKMEGLLTSGNPSLPLLFKNKQFNQLIISNIKKLMFYLKSLHTESALNLMNYLFKESDIETLNKFALFFNQDATLEIVKKFELSFETKLQLIKNYNKVSEYLLNKDPSITSLSIFSITDLYKILKRDIHISSVLLSEIEFLNKITTTPHTKEYRFIIDALSKSNDSSNIEKKRKKYYEEQIKNYIHEEGMLKNYYECYKYMSSLNAEDYGLYKNIKDALILYLNMDPSTKEYMEIANKIFELICNNVSLKKFFQIESNIQLSNMIIDYHFEEISYNLFLNLNQLLKFQKAEGKTLNSEDIETYSKLLHLDSLSYEEKLTLHENLKKENFIEKYYDDMRLAKNKVSELIKEKMLTKDNIKKYKNEELSKQYGIDVYVLDKDPFYVLVKSLEKSKDAPLENYNIYYTVDGASYSLDSSNKLYTFHSPRNNHNIAYTDFETDQVVHIYPVDSFSYYNRSTKLKATDRVFELHTPESLCNEYEQYNEILIAQKNDRNQDELNNNLKVPEMFALYCYDTITDVDVVSAHNLGLGIILVKTKAYETKSDIVKKNMHDTIMIRDAYQEGITYLDDFSQDDKYNRRK